MERYLSSSEAAARLGVSTQTVYAYVSRGFIRSASSEDPHKHRYNIEGIEALVARKRVGRRPMKIAESALHWGVPALESGISTIAEGRLLYRGRDATEFARHASLEEAARLLWNCGNADPFATTSQFPKTRNRNPISKGTPLARCSAVLNAMIESRPIWGREAAGLWDEAAQLTRLAAAGLLGTDPSNDSLHLQLAREWNLNHKATELVRVALVLIADH